MGELAGGLHVRVTRCCTAVPVPVSVTVAVPVLELLEKTRLPVDAPVEVGSNFA